MNGMGTPLLFYQISRHVGIPVKQKKRLSIKYLIAFLNNSLLNVIPFAGGLVKHLALDFVEDINCLEPPPKHIICCFIQKYYKSIMQDLSIKGGKAKK